VAPKTKESADANSAHNYPPNTASSTFATADHLFFILSSCLCRLRLISGLFCFAALVFWSIRGKYSVRKT